MKGITIKSLIIIVAASLELSSCNVLDINDTSSLSDQAIWSSETAADMYVTASYKTFTDVSQVGNSRKVFYDSYSDLMKSTSYDQYTHTYNKALLQASSFSSGSAGAFECWADVYYERIRRANVLLNDIKRYGVSSFGQEWCDIRSAEARLCRAFSYYRLIRVYGGIVLRTDISGTSGGVDDGLYDADINKKRITEAESWDFVLEELKWAAEHLPATWGTDAEPNKWKGRATKSTAYGLLSRMALYAGKWQIAIDAANKVKELGGDLAKDYAKIFQVDGKQDNSKEILFALYFQYKNEALEALNEVRNRVNLPDKTTTDAPDKESFMKLLRKERCVELAGEGFRYWDLRRWKLAENIINGQNAHGIKITKNDDSTFSYEKVECDGGTPRIFLEKYYYFSLPTSETANNKLCENNPYW